MGVAICVHCCGWPLGLGQGLLFTASYKYWVNKPRFQGPQAAVSRSCRQSRAGGRMGLADETAVHAINPS